MFRFKQRFVPSGSCTIFIDSPSVLENGVVEIKKVDAASVVLPPVENYDLGVLLKAGVPLKQVNCKLIQAASVTLPDDEPTETANDKEN